MDADEKIACAHGVFKRTGHDIGWPHTAKAVLCGLFFTALIGCALNAEAESESTSDQVASNESVSNSIVMGADEFDKTFDKYTWVVAYNAFLNNMRAQLDRGVRGFMLDLYPSNTFFGVPILLCHKRDDEKCDSGKVYVDEMNDVFVPWLKAHPNEVITIFLESYVTREMFEKELRRIPDIEKLMFKMDLFQGRDSWPTLREIIDSGGRIIMTSDSRDLQGHYNINDTEFGIFPDGDLQVQNTYDLGSNALDHKWECVARWPAGPTDPAVPAVPCTTEGMPKGCPGNGQACTT